MSKNRIDCPVCNHTAILSIKENQIFPYRGIDYSLDYYFYKCISCGEQFTTNDLDLRTLSQIPNSIWSEELKNSELSEIEKIAPEFSEKINHFLLSHHSHAEIENIDDPEQIVYKEEDVLELMKLVRDEYSNRN